jgi:hypothetical protein
MDQLTDEEMEFIKRNVVLIQNKQVTMVLHDLIGRELDLLKTPIGKDEDLRESTLWNIIGLGSAIMQLKPGGWGMEDIDIIPSMESPTQNDQSDS